MADLKKKSTEDPEAVIESALNRTELFIERNGKKLLTALIVIVAAVGGYLAYEHLYVAPRSNKASDAMFRAQHQFEIDSFAVALNGNASMAGFLEIIDKWGGTPQANLARHYAGQCYLYLGEFQKAIDYFGKFSNETGSIGTIITANNIGLTGDAYVELGNMEQGVLMYEKAAAFNNNTDTTPKYLKKAAMVNEALGRYDKALEQYTSIKNNFGSVFIARDIDKYIARVQQQM